jgi:ADP-ribose pyrophosphatase
MAFVALGERQLYAWRSFKLVEQEFEAPGGERFTRTFLRHPGAVAIVPIEMGDRGPQAVLVRQFRAPLGRDLLEIPAGTLDQGETESPDACAVRELEEEIGATAGSLEHVITYTVAAGVSDEQLHLYVATQLTFGERSAQGLEEEAMTTERLPLADVDAAISSGRIADAKTIIGLMHARDRAQ